MVSIIITTYNYARFLPESIASVKDQSFNEWECIVVDSGSTDDTSVLMSEITASDKRIRYVRQQNHGVSAARNTGIKLSTGDYIQFLDGDDMLQKNKISSQISAFLNKPEADIIYSDVRFFDDGNPEVFRNSLTGDKSNNWLPEISGRGFEVLHYLKRFNFLVTHSPLIRRRVLDSIEKFDERMPALEDWDFWLRCGEGNFYFHFNSAPDGYAIVRVHSNSLSKRKDLMRNGNFTLIVKRIFNGNAVINYRLYFFIKFVDLFWNTIFSSGRIPKIPLLLRFFSILLFPLWILMKISRALKLIG